MNVLFLSMVKTSTLNGGGIYADLLSVFAENGHNVYVVTPVQRREGQATTLTHDGNAHFLTVRTGNLQKVNLIEKGISTILLEGQFVKAIKKHLSDVKFDLVLYSTPPITFAKVVRYIKKRDAARTYLLLKDIFPQNAVDMGMLSKSGVKGLIYRYFRRKEKLLYALSDTIGCMSPANCEYILRENPEISADKVEVCPNSIIIVDKSVEDSRKAEIRAKYGIPTDKKVFVYGGNLGRPQGIPFLIECLRSKKDNAEAYFLVVGDGTEYGLLEEFITAEQPANVKVMRRLPKQDYDELVAACDVGLIFLDHRFTIPNFPSRLLSYLQAKLPVLACTDPNTDIGRIAESAGFGWWCSSNDVSAFCDKVIECLQADLQACGDKAFEYLTDNYSTKEAYDIIVADNAQTIRGEICRQ